MSFLEAQRKKYIYSRALALPMSDNWPRVTNKREEELSRVANMLFSKGLAASLWDAQEKAKDIIGLGGSQVPKEESKIQVESVLQGAGFSTSQLVEAAQKEHEENQQVMAAAMKQYHGGAVFTDALPMDKTVSEVMGAEPAPEPLTPEAQPTTQQAPVKETIPEPAPEAAPEKKHEDDELYKDFEG